MALPAAEYGARNWFIPDAYLPVPVVTDGPYVGHEALCVLNTSSMDASLLLTFYYEDQPPARDIQVTIPAERTRHLRLDKPEQIGGYTVPIGVPYAIKIESDIPVIIQYSRLDTTQVQCTLMTTMAFPLD
jgi:hypothetical protein